MDFKKLSQVLKIICQAYHVRLVHLAGAVSQDVATESVHLAYGLMQAGVLCQEKLDIRPSQVNPWTFH